MNPFIHTSRPISRRRFLKGAGAALALPFLDSMIAPFARAEQLTARPPAKNIRHLQ
jgi:hypothetical protein